MGVGPDCGPRSDVVGVEAARRLARGGFEVRVIEHESGHYEVREVPYGKVYDWRPDRVVFECDCGETNVSFGSAIVCSCGTVHNDVSGEGQQEVSPHPWLEDYEEWRRERDARDLRHEYFVFVEESDA
ncbi:MAG TPA: hypothetical protein VFT03_08075 [Rubrobacteraceae bacterium]|nr:hypothetical protein [Rubrobacteraceae bacterium]